MVYYNYLGGVLMQVKKSDIIEDAIQLFTEQGYHATSIQDILNRSRLSKGTFYKHFQSKGELLQAAILSIEEKMNTARDKIIIGKDESDKGIFIQQLVVIMESRVEHNINDILEDALVSNDVDLVTFIKQLRLSFTGWIHTRFKQIFTKKYDEYLIDASVVFAGFLQSMIYTNSLLTLKLSISSICSYCVHRVEEFLISVEEKKIIMFNTSELEQSLYQSEQPNFSFTELALSTGNLRKIIEKNKIKDAELQKMVIELLLFIQTEVTTATPKSILIISSLTTLNCIKEIKKTPEFDMYINTLGQMGYYPV